VTSEREVIEVVVGVIGRAHGVRGEVVVQPRTDEPERRFAVGQQLRAEGSATTFTVVSRRDHSGRMLVQFEGLTDRNAVEAVRGTVLVADVDEAEPPAEPGEYYDRQLIGLSASTVDGALIGAVVGVLHLPSQDLLQIQTDSEVRLVPFVAALVPEVDLAAGTVTVSDLSGLLDDEDTDES
jgi:16S rRNA processing protein RimM